MGKIEIKIVDKYQDDVYQDLLHRNLESDGVFIQDWDFKALSGDKEFKKNNQTIKIGAFDSGRLIGLSWGASETKSRFIINISLVEESYRKQGIYSRMLIKMLEVTKDYDEIDSFHHIFNNKVIAIKLKHNFYIIGFDQSILVGPRLRLRFFNNKKLFDLMKFRVGLISDPREVKRN